MYSIDFYSGSPKAVQRDSEPVVWTTDVGSVHAGVWILLVRCKGYRVADALSRTRSAEARAVELQLLLDLTQAHFAGVF